MSAGRARGIGLATAIAACLLGVVGVAGAEDAQPIGLASLLRIDGTTSLQVGDAFASAGDFNGDGRDDMVIGATVRGGGTEEVDGAAAIVLGGSASASRPFRKDAQVIRLSNSTYADSLGLGHKVAPAGDVNGDGLDDVIVTDPGTCCFDYPVGEGLTGSAQGSAFVIYGRRSEKAIDVSHLGAGGFEIQGVESGTVASVGDVNSDGLDDVAVASQGGNGGVNVIFGSRNRRGGFLAQTAKGGFSVLGKPGDLGTDAIAAAGDLDGDGFADIVIGDIASIGHAPPKNAYEPFGRGAAYVIYGKTDGADVDLAKPNGAAIRIGPAPKTLFAGAAVGGVGDVNGDGLDDFAVSTPFHKLPGQKEGGPVSGSVFVVYGNRGRQNISLALGRNQADFEIRGPAGSNYFGTSLAPVGDVTGDGTPDLVVTAPANSGLFPYSGGRSVVYLAPIAPPDSTAVSTPIHPVQTLPGDSAYTVAPVGNFASTTGTEVAVGAPTTCVGQPAGGVLDGPGAVYVLDASLISTATAAPQGGSLRVGTSGHDVVALSGAKRCFYALGGADRITGSPRADRVYGGGGADHLSGKSGKDILIGQDGADVIQGGPGADAIDSGDGNDRIVAGPGHDFVDCGKGHDRVVASRGDTLQHCERVSRGKRR